MCMLRYEYNLDLCQVMSVVPHLPSLVILKILICIILELKID